MKQNRESKPSTNRGSQRILFFAEAATLAHVARPMVLAQDLEDAGYEVHFACQPRYQGLFRPLKNPWRPIHSISSEQFLAALAKGSPLYSTDQLRSYVEEDLQVIKEVEPDLIVGDFRLSLSVSARLARVPYMAITNAYWSPYARPEYQVPELPVTRILGAPIANVLFKLARPLAFAIHTQPLNRVRKIYGLPSLGLDLRRTYTDADQTLYADLSELIPTFERPPNHHYIGPINWSPSIPLPEWWDELPQDKPVVYVTLGSSGQSQLLPTVLAALADLPVTVIAATAGLIELEQPPHNARVVNYLPGDKAAALANLVICNGGSPTTMQALSAGIPVIGIASNLDQYLNMSYLEKAGVGRLIRSGLVSVPMLKRVAKSMLENDHYQDCAKTAMEKVLAYKLEINFTTLVSKAMFALNVD